MSGTNVIIDKSKNLCGIINHNDNGTYTINNIAQILLNHDAPVNELESLYDITDAINIVLSKVVFTSKFYNRDEFTNIEYDDNDSIISSLIKGCRSFLQIPAGNVLYHIDNQILFDCLEIQYMIDKKCIPNVFLDLDLSKMYKISRNDGTEHNSIVLNNESLRFSNSQHNTLIITQYFNKDKSDPSPSDYGIINPPFYKSICIYNFLETNDISKLNIKIPYINLDNYDSFSFDNALAEELAKHFNNKIDAYLQSIANILSNENIVVNGNEITLFN